MKLKFAKGEVTGEDGEIDIREESFCECCGKLEPFTANIFQDGTSWCINCFKTNDNKISNKIMEKILALEKESKIKYHEAKLAWLK